MAVQHDPTTSESFQNEHLLTIQDVAQRLAVSVATIHRLCAVGMLRKVRIGRSARFASADVDALIRGDAPPMTAPDVVASAQTDLNVGGAE